MLDSTGRWRVFWLGVALAVAVVLSYLLVSFVGTLVFGVFLYYAARPIYVRLRRRVGPPSLAAATALSVLVLPIVVLFWYTFVLGLEQLGTLAAVDLAGYEDLLAPYVDFAGSSSDLGTVIESLLSDPSQLLQDGRLQEVATMLASNATQFLGAFLNSLVALFIALALAFYLLRDADRLADWVRTTFEDETLVRYGRAVDRDLQTVFFGNILTALLTGVIGAVVFSLLGTIAPPEVPVPVPILLGLLAGIGSLIPLVGMKIVNVPVALYLGVLAITRDPQLLWFPVVFFVVTMVVVDMIPDLLLRPYVSGRDLHVGLVMFSYILGPLLFGWYGLFLGPLLLVCVVHFARVVVPELVESYPEPSVPPSNHTGTRGGPTTVGFVPGRDGPRTTPETDGSGPSDTVSGTDDSEETSEPGDRETPE